MNGEINRAELAVTEMSEMGKEWYKREHDNK